MTYLCKDKCTPSALLGCLVSGAGLHSISHLSLQGVLLYIAQTARPPAAALGTLFCSCTGQPPSPGALALGSLYSAWSTRLGLPLEAQPGPKLSLSAAQSWWPSRHRRAVRISLLIGPACPGGSCAWAGGGGGASGYLSDPLVKHPQVPSYLAFLVMFSVCQSLTGQRW